MKTVDDINIFHTLEYIKNKSGEYAQAKANRIYMEEFRKTIKSRIMLSDQSGPVARQEANAYAHPDYVAHLDAMKTAIEIEEDLRWKLIAAQAMVEVWRSLGANQRAEAKAL